MIAFCLFFFVASCQQKACRYVKSWYHCDDLVKENPSQYRHWAHAHEDAPLSRVTQPISQYKTNEL